MMVRIAKTTARNDTEKTSYQFTVIAMVNLFRFDVDDGVHVLFICLRIDAWF